MDTDRFDADLRDRLGRSFGDGPSHRPLDDRLVAGHRALLRRRIGTSLASLAVVAVIGSSYALAGGNDRATDQPGYAASESSVATQPTVSAEPAPIPWRGQFVRYNTAMEVEVRPGAEVLERIENPYGYELPKHSEALTVTWKGKTYWVLLEGDRTASSGGYTSADPNGAWRDLSEWVASQVAADTAARSGDPAGDFPGVNVRFDDAGRLVADEGYRIVEQRTDIDLPDNFAHAGATTAVALVEGGGERRWWLGRIIDDQPDYIDFAAEPNQTVDEFLSFARGKYDAGVGLR
ncbi:MAG: hypothetical protein H0X12_01195 [Nocardioides sp.]|nr:hypothetical protein [Nocardioides sp.]